MKKSGSDRALRQLERSADRGSKAAGISPGTWISVRGEAPASGKRWTKRLVKKVWVGRVEKASKDGYLVRYALKIPRNERYVGEKLYFAPMRSVIEPVENVAREIGWRFNDSLAMLGAAAAVAF